MEQKFKRGNLVKLKTGHTIYSGLHGMIIELSPELVGEKAIIEYSYKERYGCGEDCIYQVMFLNDGHQLAWKSNDELEFINEGGEHLFEVAQINRQRLISSIQN